MNIPHEDAVHYDLPTALAEALSQSRTLLKRLADQSAKIEKLREENEQLQEQLTQYRALPGNDNAREDYDTQVQQLFQKNIEKQAQIDDLNKRLRTSEAKERKWRQRYPLLSSPMLSSEGVATRSNSPRFEHLSALSHAHPEIPEVAVTGRKQYVDKENLPPTSLLGTSFDVQSEYAVDELAEPTGYVTLHDQPVESKTWAPGNFEERAQRQNISALAEDGDSYISNTSVQVQSADHVATEPETSKNRLNMLLTTPEKAREALTRPSFPIATSASPVKRTKTKPKQLQQQGSTDPTTPSDPTPSTIQPKTKANQISRSSFLPMKRKHVPGPEDEEPFRARPVQRLNLSHFKLNPATNNAVDHAYNEVIRSRHERKCLPGCIRPECCGNAFRALVQTIGTVEAVQNPNQSDEELLREFLGPGSEERIQNLTRVARENLVHEARAKQWANLYGKHRSMHERAASPPGYWNTEMPASQEELENREQARRNEREEVTRRYQEAMGGNGRWIFGDEVGRVG